MEGGIKSARCRNNGLVLGPLSRRGRKGSSFFEILSKGMVTLTIRDNSLCSCGFQGVTHFGFRTCFFGCLPARFDDF